MANDHGKSSTRVAITRAKTIGRYRTCVRAQISGTSNVAEFPTLLELNDDRDSVVASTPSSSRNTTSEREIEPKKHLAGSVRQLMILTRSNDGLRHQGNHP